MTCPPSATVSPFHSHTLPIKLYIFTATSLVRIGEIGALKELSAPARFAAVSEAIARWWQQQAMDKILAAQPLKVPTMLVDSLCSSDLQRRGDGLVGQLHQ